MKPEILASLNQMIAQVTGIPASQLTADFDLIESGVVDSIQVLQLIDALESQFKISISMDEMLAYTTVGKIASAVACLQSRMAGLGPITGTVAV